MGLTAPTSWVMCYLGIICVSVRSFSRSSASSGPPGWAAFFAFQHSKTKAHARARVSRAWSGVTFRRGAGVTRLTSLIVCTFLGSRKEEPLNLAMGNLLEFGFPPLTRMGDQEEDQAFY